MKELEAKINNIKKRKIIIEENEELSEKQKDIPKGKWFE